MVLHTKQTGVYPESSIAVELGCWGIRDRFEEPERLWKLYTESCTHTHTALRVQCESLTDEALPGLLRCVFT